MTDKHTTNSTNTDLFGFVEEEPPVAPKRKWLRNTAIVLVAMLLLVAVVSVAYLWKLNQSFSEVQTISDPFPVAENRVVDVDPNAQNILLIGSDTRGEIGDEIEGIRGQRSDTMMVAHIPADRESVQVMSIMRDNWVTLPDGQEAKINAALSLGGVPMLVETVEGLLQDQIDHVMIIDFNGFEGLTNALGGVTINNPQEFSDRGSNFPEGEITLQGEDALNYVRARYPFTDGDYTRVKNQQIILKGILGTVLSQETLTNPIKVQNMVGSITPYILADAGVTSSYLVSEAFEMRNVRNKDIRFFTSPTSGTGTSADGQSIVVPDWEAWERLSERFQNGTVAEWDPETLQ